MNEEWMQDANCRGVDPEVFFPPLGHQGLDAKRICARCDVRQVCEDWATATRQEYGIWGGVTSNVRRRGDEVRAA